MCAICGIVDFLNPTRVSYEDALRMSRKMIHRGPDGDGIFSERSVALAHNRLAVMDPKNGAQPMTVSYEGKSYTVVYNGELYNIPELTEDLSAHGIKLKTRCDTEVLLYTFAIHGEDTPKLLNGIFAFAVYDHENASLFLARDRLGVKPLYYSVRNGTLIFASEIKGMLAHPDIPPYINEEGLWQLLFLSPNLLPGGGVFRDISELEPGECAVFHDGVLRIERYWRLHAEPWVGSRADAVEGVRFLVKDAICRQLVSDVPLCSLLSGGLDSSIVSAVASKAYRERGERLSTYSFEYEGNRENFRASLFQPQGDDAFASYLAEFLGTEHTVLTVPTTEVAELLLPAVLYRDFPGQADIDSSLLYFCRQIKKSHTVGLSGECADEIFGGYPWFYRPEMLDSDFFPWIHQPLLRPSLFDVDTAKGFDYISSLYRDSLSSYTVLDSDSEETKTARRACRLSVDYFMTSLLQRKDRMSMATGLEVRVPFADHRILEFVYNVPWEIKFKGGVEKALLREAMADFLPERILHRKKSPYPKTHNPEYAKKVQAMLTERLARGGILATLLNRKQLDTLIASENATWFGQLMSTPQLIAWLVQFDFWWEAYRAELV